MNPRLLIAGATFALCLGASVSSWAQETDGAGPIVERPVVSPDGTKILFESNAGKTVDIWIANRDGSSARPLILLGGSDERDADWSPDGTRIAFASNRGGSWNIWTARADGTDLRQLTNDSPRDLNPRYSPDGVTLLFLSNRSGKNEIWLISSAGGGPSVVGLIPVRVSAPDWSPNGERIVYSGCIAETCNLYTIARDGSSFSQITEGAFKDWMPRWAASGIVFTSNRGGAGFGLWSVQADGSGLQQVAGQGFDPSWDPAGGIVFVSSSDSADQSLADVWGVTRIGEVGRRLTRIAGFLSQGDLNGNGVTNCEDLALLRTTLGKRQGQVGFDSRADIDADGVVSVRDLALVTQKLPAGSTCK